MRLRLFISFILIAFISIASFLIVVRQSTIQEVRSYMFRGGMAGVEGIVRDLEAHYESTHTWEGTENLLGIAGKNQGNRRGNKGEPQGIGAMMGGMMNQRLRLADAKGNLILDTEGSNAAGSLTGDELQQAIPLNLRGEVVGYLLPEGGMAFSTGDDTVLLERLTRAAYIAAGVAVGFALILAIIFSTRLLRPVRALTKAASSLAGGDLSMRVSVQGDDELATLGQTFNQMASTLENVEESRRAMTADIAHELRTPLAVQRAQLEALQDGVYPATDENLSSILEQNILLTRMVEDLRTLALADSGQLQLEKSQTDLQILVGRVLDRFKPQAEERGVDLQFSTQGDCPVLSLDPGRVEQILGNLISNALRYTPGGNWVETSLECTTDKVVLLVHDNGPGIPEGSQERIFKRFYRADHSRSRSEGGSGLGLAIARQLAEAQGGTLTAGNHPMGGALFRLTFPKGVISR
jgi:two-component system sensor histidine kinase BaeS